MALRHKIKTKNLEIALSLFRVILAPFVMIALFFSRDKIALSLFVFIAAAGILDEFISRLRGSSYYLRKLFDPLADKFLIIFSVIGLASMNRLPLWLMAIFVAKDSLIIVGSIIHLFRRKLDIRTTVLGRVTYFFQSVLVFSIFLGKLDSVLVWICVLLAVISGTYTIVRSGITLQKYRKEYDAYRLMKLIKFADVFTLSNAICGLISIVFAMNNQLDISAALLVVAVALDFLDGKISRMMSQPTSFGKELDSLADTISFGVAPAVFGFSVINTKLAIISFIIFLSCGILRLARYNVMDVSDVYRGLPITFNGIIIPLIHYINLNHFYYPYIYLLLAILMISPIQVKKVV